MSNAKKEKFYERWMQKVHDQPDGKYQIFDKFIALYIIYNFLYVEAFRLMQNENSPSIKREYRQENQDKSTQNSSRFPDELAATRYIIDFLGGAKEFCHTMKLDGSQTRDDLNNLRQLVNRDQRNVVKLTRPFKFKICLDSFTGEGDLEADKKLAESLLKDNKQELALAVLKMIYQVRCNLFHGRKGLDTPENSAKPQDLLKPLCSILEDLVEELFSKLKKEWQ